MVRGGRERKERERVMERVGWSSPNTEKEGAREGERKRDRARGGPNKQIILFSTHNGKCRDDSKGSTPPPEYQ